jgi:hypothetical protein
MQIFTAPVSCAMSRLPGSISFPIYSCFCMVLGTLAAYLIGESKGAASLLTMPTTTMPTMPNADPPDDADSSGLCQ